MKSIVKSMAVVGQVVGLLVGAKFTTPANQASDNIHQIVVY